MNKTTSTFKTRIILLISPLRKQDLAAITIFSFLLYSCASQSQIAIRYDPDVLVTPITIPSKATLWADGLQIDGSIVLVAREWPNASNSGNEYWYADASVPKLETVVARPELEIRIPTTFIPLSIYYWFYDELESNTGLPTGEPKYTGECNQTVRSCVEVLEETNEIAVRPPIFKETGLTVIQVEWIAPKSNTTSPLIARLSWALSYSD